MRQLLTFAPVTIASRVSLIIADLIAIGVTWHGTYRTTKLARIAGQSSMDTYAGILLRDGTSSIYDILFFEGASVDGRE